MSDVADDPLRRRVEVAPAGDPARETTVRPYDELDLQRAEQSHVRAIPLVSSGRRQHEQELKPSYPAASLRSPYERASPAGRPSGGLRPERTCDRAIVVVVPSAPTRNPVTPDGDTTGPAEGTADDVEVTDNAAESRYEAWVDGERAGVLTYRRRPDRISMIHTEVNDRFGGRGIGTRLAVTALDAARADGLAVLPICPLVAGYIRRHPEYQDVVVEGYRRAAPSSDQTGRPGGAP